MSCYLIAAIDIEDRETYGKYENAAAQVLAGRSDIELLAIDDSPFLLEGAMPGQRIVLLRFPSEEVFKEWYHGEGYQSAMQFRKLASKTAFLLGAKGIEPG